MTYKNGNRKYRRSRKKAQYSPDHILLPCKMGFSHKNCQVCKAQASLLLDCQLKQRSHLGRKNLCQNKCLQALPVFLGIFNGHAFPNIGQESVHNTRKSAFTRKGNEAPAGQTSCHSEGMREKMPSPPVTLEVTHWLSNLASSPATMSPSGMVNDSHYSSHSQARMPLVLWYQWRVSSYSFEGHLDQPDGNAASFCSEALHSSAPDVPALFRGK